MILLAHGIDLVEVKRVEQMLGKHPQRFLDKCFTPAELKYCQANPQRMGEHLAARFAAKEAILKALGTGWSGGILWTDAEVVRETTGRPTVRLHGKAAALAESMGITVWSLTISHVKTHAVASAIGMGPGE